MSCLRSPVRALFTVLAFVLATIAPDRASTREHGSQIVERQTASLAAIPALWNVSVHTVQRAGSPRSPSVPQPWIGFRAETLGESTRAARRDSERPALRRLGHHAFTYDATAPPSIVEL
jgi:hypothetical protein